LVLTLTLFGFDFDLPGRFRKEKKGKKRKARLGLIAISPLSKSPYSEAAFDRGEIAIYLSRAFSLSLLNGRNA